jgi:hypothetical protein
METLDTLQLNASDSPNQDGTDEDLNEGSSKSWELKVLIKRIIILTSEAAAQVTSQSSPCFDFPSLPPSPSSLSFLIFFSLPPSSSMLPTKC